MDDSDQEIAAAAEALVELKNKSISTTDPQFVEALLSFGNKITRKEPILDENSKKLLAARSLTDLEGNVLPPAQAAFTKHQRSLSLSCKEILTIQDLLKPQDTEEKN
jgi:hypothetical protein